MNKVNEAFPKIVCETLGIFLLLCTICLLSAPSFNMDDHVLAYVCKDNISWTLNAGEGSFSYFSIRDNEFVLGGPYCFTDGSCD